MLLFGMCELRPAHVHWNQPCHKESRVYNKPHGLISPLSSSRLVWGLIYRPVESKETPVDFCKEDFKSAQEEREDYENPARKELILI